MFKKRIKDIVLGVVLGGIISTSFVGFAEMQSIQAFFNDIKIQINGNIVDTGNDKPFLYNGRTYVPTRFVAEGLGASVKWNESSNTVEIESVVKEVYTPPVLPIVTPTITIRPELENYQVVESIGTGKYVGEAKYDYPNGIGTYFYKDGGKFFGSWESGKREGSGTLINDNGSKYMGEFKNDVATGKGTMIISNNEFYMGDLSNGEITGKGTYHYSNGNAYYGDFVNGKRNGFGVMINTSSNVLSGVWNQDQFINANTPIITNNTPIINNTAPITPIAPIIIVAPTPAPVNTALLAEQKRQYEQAISDIQTQITNAEGQRTVKVLVEDPSEKGKYKWEMQVDQRILQPLQDRLKAKQNEYSLWKAANGQ